jgi:hypothetical protein
VASGHVLALTGLGKPVDAKGLERKQITQSSFKPDGSSSRVTGKSAHKILKKNGN